MSLSSRFPLSHYRFVTSLLCCNFRMSLPLFLTSQYYLFKVSIVSISVCYVTALFYASTVPTSVKRHYLFRVFLRHYTIFSRFPLFYYLLITSLICSIDFDCLFFCLLRQSTISLRFLLVHYLIVTSLLCSSLRLSLPLFVTSIYSLLKIFIVLLSVCYVTILSLQGCHCFIICPLRPRSFLGFFCYFIRGS